MIPVLIGYFPKKTVRGPAGLGAAHVTEVCSASSCISPGPAKRIGAWNHSHRGLYDTPDLARSVVGPGEESFERYAFKQCPGRIERGRVEPEDVLSTEVVPLTAEFAFLGFDAVSRSYGTEFECSPLSCKYGAATVPCNAHCLFDTLDAALEAAGEFSRGSGEPGPYYGVEVFRLRGRTGGREPGWADG